MKLSLPKALLKSLGLTEPQAHVYLAALEFGQISMQDLARRSGVKRTSIYNFIDELTERGLLMETKKRRRKLYSAIHPEQLLELERTRVTEIERLMPELLAIYTTAHNQPRVTFYEGIEGTEEVYADML